MKDPAKPGFSGSSYSLNPYCLEAVSKPSIGFKVKAAARFKLEEYIGYFEDLNQAPNAEIGPKDNLETVPNMNVRAQFILLRIRN